MKSHDCMLDRPNCRGSIAGLHKSMVSQTKWILSGMLGIGGLLLAVAKYF
ncbi:hypothetical protein [Leptospira wolffii]|nr:hypothetical protein [Leptospira wolffii]